MDTLVSTAWLAAELGAPDLRILDGTWHMPQLGRDARREFAEAHIPGAAFFDIDRIADTSVPLPHMLPSPAAFAASVAVSMLQPGAVDEPRSVGQYLKSDLG